MLPSLLMTFGVLGLAFGLFGIALAQMLLIDGCPQAAAETRQNAYMILVASGAMLVVATARAVWM